MKHPIRNFLSQIRDRSLHVSGVFAALILFTVEFTAQAKYKVLFLGNSYTTVNNLPQLIHDVALSAGDTLVFDSYAPGGYQLIDHSQDVNSQNKIMAGGWDYVVMQGQSQEPVILTNQFTGGGGALYNLIRQYNSCAVPMLYITWGRKNGDAANCASFPAMCTYQAMDDALKKRYLDMAASMNGEVSPVSVVWRYLRQNHPGINLYQADESHPSAEGSYAAACCFYAGIFKKDPTLVTYNYSLGATDAATIRNAAKTQVFDSLGLWDYKKLPVSDFRYQVGPGNNELQFFAMNQGVNQTYYWDLGDGGNSTLQIIPHSYLSNGTYTVSLTTTNCDLQGVHTSVTDTVVQFCAHTPTIYTAQPWLCKYDTLWTQPAHAYQWYLGGSALPETKQYVAGYSKYGTAALTVISTLNGCSELSAIYAGSADWSGYYFDAIGDPCKGDTVFFAVLHFSGALPGQETILWYKNGSLLTAMSNKDTMMITGGGKYECRVISPASNCPFDTTFTSVNYDCGATVGFDDARDELFFRIYPNPVSDLLVLERPIRRVPGKVRIYGVDGVLVKVVVEKGYPGKIDVSDLPSGMYFLASESLRVKFVKE